MEKIRKRNYSNRDLTKRLIPYYSSYKFLFFTDLLASALTIVAEVALPLIIGRITDMAISDSVNLTFSYLLQMVLLYFILKIVEVAANYYMQYYGHMMGVHIERDMRKDVFSHIQYLSDEFYSKNKTGQLLARVTTDLFDVTEFAHHVPEEFFKAGIKVLVTFLILININVPLTLIMYVMLPLMLIFTNSTRKRIRKTQKEQRNQIGEINSTIEDSLLGIKVIRSFANEEYEIESFDSSNLKFVDIKSVFYRAMADFTAITKILDALMYLVVVLVGGMLLIREEISPGAFTLYIMYTTTLLATVTRLITFLETFEKGMTGVERFAEIMDIEPAFQDSENAVELKDVKGHIEFENVSFSYRDNEGKSKEKVLDNINLDIRPGSKLALVGPSGSGKTTITNLIPRFYDVDSGSIKIDGIDVRDIKLRYLRNNIGIVQQDVYLFSGSILDNIKYGKIDTSRQEVLEAAKMAGAMEFISNLPHGLDTYVGERGLMLSGGQKQRISIARVFLKNPPILILDEATSALDNRSEQVIQESLKKLSQGRTTITIAHRLSTIVNSDEIIVLTEDGIQEKGNHEELLEKKGIYYGLYHRIDNHI